MTTKDSTWKNRIEGSGVEDPNEILQNPDNWRTHSDRQQHTLDAVMNEVGWVQQIVVNKETGHLVDGHLRCALAIENGETEVPVLYVNLSEQEEALVLATLDPLSSMAGIDPDRLSIVMDKVQSDDLAIATLLDDLADEAGITVASDDDDEVLSTATSEDDMREVAIAFNLVFDDEDQQLRWYEFLRYVREQYEDAETVGERVNAYLEEIGITIPSDGEVDEDADDNEEESDEDE